jgi:hypothetical protein
MGVEVDSTFTVSVENYVHNHQRHFWTLRIQQNTVCNSLHIAETNKYVELMGFRTSSIIRILNNSKMDKVRKPINSVLYTIVRTL